MKKIFKLAIIPMVLLLLTSCNMKSKEALGYTEKTINMSKYINQISDIRYLGQGIYGVNTAKETTLIADKYKLMNSNGNLITDKTFSPIGDNLNFDKKKLVSVGIGNNEVLINKNGEILTKPYEYIDYLGDGVYRARNRSKDGYIIGFINSDGKIISNLTKINWNITYDPNFLPYRDKNGKCGFKDKTGKVIIPGKFDDVETLDSLGNLNNLVFVCKDKKWGILNKQGKMIVDFKFDKIGIFNEGLAPVWKDGKVGFIDVKGNLKMPFKFDNCIFFIEGLCSVSLNNKVGVIDKSGNIVIPFKFDIVGYFHDGLALCRIDNKRGLINTKGEYIIKPTTNNTLVNDDKNIIVNMESKSYLADTKGKKIITTAYDEIDFSLEDSRFIIISKNKKIGLLDRQGKEVIPPEFDDISGFKNDYAIVKKQNKYGIIDIKGKYKIPLKYDEIKYICKNYYAVKKDGKWGIIDINEKVIKPIEHDNAIIGEPREKSKTQIFLIKGKKVLVLDFKN